METVVIYSAALQNVPRALDEAARVDGANFFQIWWHIAAPMTKTAMIAIFIPGRAKAPTTNPHPGHRPDLPRTIRPH